MSLVVWKGPTNALSYAINSPKFEWGDRVKVTDIYHGQQSLCAASMLARGTYGTGARGGYVVNQCTCNNMRGGIGELSIEWEAGGTGASQPLPTGEVVLSTQEFYPKVERNAYFANGGLYLQPQDIALAYASMHASTPFAQANALTQLAARAASGGAVGASATLGQALATMLQKGEETYYQAGFRYVWTYFAYTLPVIETGGLTQSPVGIAPVPWSSTTAISWLRLADSFEPAGVNGSMWKIISTWLGGQSGYWDSNLYPP